MSVNVYIYAMSRFTYLLNAHSIISLINRSIRYNLSSSTIVHYTLLWRGTNVQFKHKVEQEPVITESKSSLQSFLLKS